MGMTGFSLLFLFILAAVAAGVIIAASSIIGRRAAKTTAHHLPYECGIDPATPSRIRMPVKFFLVAVQFIIFDVEVVFLYPWARVFLDYI